jgi:5'-methylthioadenosine/S-adenosylhomocysteine nucleosidase
MLHYQSLFVVCAMPEELAAAERVLVQAGARRESKEWPLGVESRHFQLSGGRSLTLLQSGVGLVNAAVTLGVGFSQMRPEGVVLLGVGGALQPELEVGEALVVSRVLQHDSVSSMECGIYPMAPGSFFPDRASVEGHEPSFVTDPGITNWLEQALDAGARRGTLISGSEFVGAVERKRALGRLARDAWLVDMEGAAVAQVAVRAGVPFGILKTVADRLSPDGSIGHDFVRTLNAAAQSAARVLERFVAG